MPGSPQSSVVTIRATLGHEYGLDKLEVDILAEDVAANLQALYQDIAKPGAAGAGDRLGDALAALSSIAHNLRLDGLGVIAQDLTKHRGDRKREARTKALKELKAFVDGFAAAIDSGPAKRRRKFGVRNAAQTGNQNHVSGRGR